MNEITGTVKLLGGFSLTLNNITITDTNAGVKKPWAVLEYLVAFRGREISSNDLIHLIWDEDESVNPAGALKTLMFRVRKLLDPFGLPTHELILQRGGTYLWNPDVRLDSDVDKFEELCRRAQEQGFPDDARLELLLQALALYEGDFLPKAQWEDWVNPVSTYYHTLFIQVTHGAVEILSARAEWESVIRICQKALQLESFDEDLHCSLILALYHSGLRDQALEHLNRTVQQYFEEFSLAPSDRMRELFRFISKEENRPAANLAALQDSLDADSAGTGPISCDYSVFRELYRFRKRLVRADESVCLCQFSIHRADGTLPPAPVLARSMERLQTAIEDSARPGDVFTRCSVSQYLVLLTAPSREDAESVMKQVISEFHKLSPRREACVSGLIQPVTEKPALVQPEMQEPVADKPEPQESSAHCSSPAL